MQTRRVRIAILVILAGASFFQSACSWPSGLVTSSSLKPDMAALSGQWQPTDSSLSAVKKAYKSTRPGRLILTPDGRALFDEVPNFFEGKGNVLDGVLSGQGTWSVVENREWHAWVISISTPSKATELFITGSATNYELLAIIGDPDSREALTFALTP
jgi:hypothetical protein